MIPDPEEGAVFRHRAGSDDAGKRLDRMLADLDVLPSRAFIARLVERGLASIDGKTASKRHVVKEGQTVELQLPPAVRSELIAEEAPLDIRYEDQYLIVLSKEAGMVVHPACGHATGTLVNALLAYCDGFGQLGGHRRPGIVHRLDKDTSGLMMVAKDDATQAALATALKEHTVDRRYISLVRGRVRPDRGLVDAPVGRNPSNRFKMSVTDAAGSREARTAFVVLARYAPASGDAGYTLVECRLETGRTHQVRVHMAFAGHPVAGDPLYAGRGSEGELGLMRQFLHSYRLALEHPVTGAKVEVVDSLPDDLRDAVGTLEGRLVEVTEYGREVMPGVGLSDPVAD